MQKRILVIGTSTFHMRRWFHYVTPVLPKDIKVDMYVTVNNATADMFEGAEHVYETNKAPLILRPLLHIPKVRGKLTRLKSYQTLKRIISERHYDVINIHQLLPPTYEYTKIAKRNGIKIVLTPWGSDVLRCPWYRKSNLKKAFQLADCVTYNLERFSEKYISMYDVNPDRMFFAGFGSEIFDLIPQYKGKYTKKEMASNVGIPYADYYITCGYMASHAQRHKQIIESLGVNKDFIPKNSLLLFPFTYGDGRNESYMSELRKLCDSYGLQCHFVTEYLTNEQMAMFRCVADLFIHIQPTDAASASLAEYLLANVQVINGKWLDYPHLEKDGMPYHLCNSLEDLPAIVGRYLKGELPRRGISEGVREDLMKGAWSQQKKYWKDLYCQI